MRMEHPSSSAEAPLVLIKQMTTRTAENDECGRIFFANGSSITLRELCPLKRLAFRNNWLPPSGADRAFVKACSRRLHARMEATVRELRACHA